MSRKRDRSSQAGSGYFPNSFPKRRRPSLLRHDSSEDSTFTLDVPSSQAAASKLQNTVVVSGLPTDCSVLDLKSRFEIYGSISRTRMEPNGLAYITFRSHDSASSAVSAALDPSFRVTLLSKPVQVMWATDPVPQWREGVAKKEGASSRLSSRLVRPEVPLSRRGKGNKLVSAVVNPRETDSGNGIASDEVKKDSREARRGAFSLDEPFKGREIVAYDDIL